MDLIFEETVNVHRCGSEVIDYGFKVRCALLTSRIVTIPTGLHYFDGKLNFSQSMLRITIPICKDHEMQLNAAFHDLFAIRHK